MHRATPRATTVQLPCNWGGQLVQLLYRYTGTPTRTLTGGVSSVVSVCWWSGIEFGRLPGRLAFLADMDLPLIEEASLSRFQLLEPEPICDLDHQPRCVVDAR